MTDVDSNSIAGITSIDRLIDEFNAADFRSAERLVDAVIRQGVTPSGYPRIRPGDCGLITDALKKIYKAHIHLFRTSDTTTVERYDRVVERFFEFVRKQYPSEALGVVLLRAEIALVMNDWQRARSLLDHYAERPYLIEGGLVPIVKTLATHGRAVMMSGQTEGLTDRYVMLTEHLVKVSWRQSWFILNRFSPMLTARRPSVAKDGILTAAMLACLRFAGDKLRDRGTRTGLALQAFGRCLGVTAASVMAVLAARYRRRPSLAADTSEGFFVSRAMGGIGDLLMMTPGLRALAVKQGKPVAFATPRRFHAIFDGNLDVRLLDMDGPPIDLQRFRGWYNLTICPAGGYESQNRPNVKKGRVELFAGGMGIARSLLRKSGFHIHVPIRDAAQAFRDDFLAKRGTNGRALVGVQPYSRDSYKDHPRILEIIERIAEKHDVVVFHHTAAGMPSGPGIYTTAGMKLDQSLALVSALDVMLSVDSAFLHAAAGFDVPVVALFGPTDARTFTAHHSQVRVIWKRDEFPCMPCWRNEDLPCKVTRAPGRSPCMAAIGLEEVIAAVDETLAQPSVRRVDVPVVAAAAQ